MQDLQNRSLASFDREIPDSVTGYEFMNGVLYYGESKVDDFNVRGLRRGGG